MRFLPTFLLSLSLVAACTRPAPQPGPRQRGPGAGIVPASIPAGYGFPGDRDTLQGWADAWDETRMRTHAWDLWAGMAADSGQTFEGHALPVWETWCGTEQVFPYTCKQGRARPGRHFERPAQIAHMARRKHEPTPRDTQVVSFNKFNPEMAAYLGQQHAGPGGASYDYTSQTSLAALNAAWPAGTSIADREIEDAPIPAMSLKPVIYVVKARGLTPLPLWFGTTQSTAPVNATPETWTTCVLADPAGASVDPATAPVPATAAQIAQAVKNPALACKAYLYAPLASLYHFQMDAHEAAAWNEVAKVTEDSTEGDIQAEAGDYAVLVAMHAITKEIESWTWQTFWWQPGEDAPGGFPGTKADMTSKVEGVWRNYAMCAAWHQTRGKGSTEMAVCINPYLETSTGIPDGQRSNCMTCHGTATAGPIQDSALTSLNYPENYLKPIDFDTDPRFANLTRTDFSWAIHDNATPAQ
jgi:hypothetical protein